jgi:CRISPR-associated endonuclease/helicase Cas3
VVLPLVLFAFVLSQSRGSMRATHGDQFEVLFKALTGNGPFPWQAALFRRFIGSAWERFPEACDLPTGLGKTSVIAVWLLALAHFAKSGMRPGFPRRLVYVVNRRTVVDQATRDVVALRRALIELPELRDTARALQVLRGQELGAESPLAISTLRGEFADNAEWRDDPSRAAVVVGTVDMIGSRLLFNGYGRGFRSRPLHAAFLGQDVLLIHDEAHLEHAFQILIEAIKSEQGRYDREVDRFHVMALSATARSGTDVFTLTPADREHEIVAQRINARKGIAFHPVDDRKNLAKKIADIALSDDLKTSGQAILLFLRALKDVEAVESVLRKAGQQVCTLTGTLRGYERDRLAAEDTIFARFMPNPESRPASGTVYLICTSAGEIGVNISADHLVCDLTPYDSMAQRLGRVNRFGYGSARVEVVVAPGKADDALSGACTLTERLLRKLPVRNDITDDGLTRHDASPAALSALPESARRDAFSPKPELLVVTEVLLDAWSMTTIQDLPGRPPVDEYLHGRAGWEPPQTQVAWREEVGHITAALAEANPPAELLEDFPLKAHELLREQTDRVYEQLELILERIPDCPVWLVERSGSVERKALRDLVAKKGNNDQLEGTTVILPSNAGGLSGGHLRGEAPAGEPPGNDIAELWLDESGQPRRRRVRGNTAPKLRGMRLVRVVDIASDIDDQAGGEGAADPLWFWYVQPRSADDDGSRLARAPELLSDHLAKAESFAGRIATPLLDEAERAAVVLAAKWHDLGKNRRVWQRSIGNATTKILAKSGPGMRSMENIRYRHEFGSLLDLERDPDFVRLGRESRELVLHLVAAHHGRARPHFPDDEVFDPERASADTARVAREVPRRFAQLQRRHGRWRLAYLESLVRAADALASQQIEVAEPPLDVPTPEAAE